jgi:hypothetical protein
LQTRKAKNSLQKLACLLDEQSQLTGEVRVLEAMNLSLENEIRDTTSILDRTFSPNGLEEAEREFAEGNAYDDSIQLSIDHINHGYQSALISCDAAKNKKPAHLYLKSIEDQLKRICSIETFRLFGKSEGPLPVYKKRAELNRLIASNDALIITAQTGSGKVSIALFWILILCDLTQWVRYR